MNTSYTEQQIQENMNNFDFNSLFATNEPAKKLDFSAPVTVAKKDVQVYVSNLPESCIQLNGLRALFHGIR